MLSKKFKCKQFNAQHIVAFAQTNCSAQVAQNTAVYQANKPSKQANKSVFLQHANNTQKAVTMTTAQRFKAALANKMTMLTKLAAQYTELDTDISTTAKSIKVKAVTNMLFNYAKRLKLPEYMNSTELCMCVMSSKLVKA